MMQQIKITILYSYLTINKWEYLLNITPNKTVLPATGQKELILAVFTMFKVSKSFSLILTYFFGISQLIIGKKSANHVLTKSIIKYSSLYLIILYLGFLLIFSVSQSNVSTSFQLVLY
ncbi:Uncharacterised protein [Staphylococcus aureus]|nr:Uncharacterised protein [Staphylococcus aureus]